MTGPPHVPDEPTNLFAELAVAVDRPADAFAADGATPGHDDGPVAVVLWRFGTGSDRGVDPAARLARLLVRIYTTPGAVVVDLDNNAVLRSTTRALGRRYVSLTTPTRPMSPTPLAQPAGLVTLRWPRQQTPVRDLADLLAACRELLTPDGCLIVSRTSTPEHRSTDDARAVLAAARRARLRRLHHLVAVTVPAAVDQFTYVATAAEGAAVHRDTVRGGGHIQDLLVFVVSAGPDEGQRSRSNVVPWGR